MPSTDTLIIQFDTPISQKEIHLFRGAILAQTPSEDILFHNHIYKGLGMVPQKGINGDLTKDTDSLRYSYPLIQYKKLESKAAIVCLGEGLEQIWDFFASGSFDLNIGHRPVHLMVEDISRETTEIGFSEANDYHYRLRDWLPLNKENYQKWNETGSLSERISMLENILKGNILSMLKGCGITVADTITVEINSLTEPKTIVYKHVPLLAFDAVFSANISLPSLIGLGRHVSIGYGTLHYEGEPKHHNLDDQEIAFPES